jgi:excisionase family DNA binding protein
MEDVVLTDGEVAALLKVSRATVRRMWWRKQLPAPIQVGVCNRWRKSDIDQWLANQPTNNLYDTPDACERKLV